MIENKRASLGTEAQVVPGMIHDENYFILSLSLSIISCNLSESIENEKASTKDRGLDCVSGVIR